MKIVVLDGYAADPGDISWEPVERLGELTVYDRTKYDDAEIIERIGDAELVLTNKVPIGARLSPPARVSNISVCSRPDII